jgi:hypothetical protein
MWQGKEDETVRDIPSFLHVLIGKPRVSSLQMQEHAEPYQLSYRIQEQIPKSNYMSTAPDDRK